MTDDSQSPLRSASPTPGVGPRSRPSSDWLLHSRLSRAIVLASGLALGAYLVERGVGLLFSLSLATMGVNGSALLVLLLLGGFLYPLGLDRAWPHSRRFVALCWLALGVLALLAISGSPPIAVLGAFGGLIALTPPLLHALAGDRETTLLGLGLGLETHVLLRSINNTAPFDAGPVGLAQLGVLAAGTVLAARYVATPGKEAVTTAGSQGAARAVFGFLFFQAVFLGAPWGLSLFYPAPAWAALDERRWLAWMVAGVQVGIALGTLLGLRLARRGLRLSPLVLALPYAAAVIALFAPTEASSYVPVLVVATQVLGLGLLGLLLGRAERVEDVRATGRRLGLFQLAIVALVVLHALARTWSFVPEILWPLVRGREPLFLALLGLAVLLGGLGGQRRRPEARPRRIAASEALSLVALAAVALALVVTDWTRPPAARAEAGKLRLLSLNVQFFRIGDPPITSSLEAIAELLESERPDVVGLQETDTGTALTGGQNAVHWLGERLGYSYVSGPPSTANTPGVAILTRCRVLASSWARLPFSRSIPRGAVKARLDCAGTELDVINAHIHWVEPYLPGEPTAAYERDQRDQVAAVLELIDPVRRTILLGDFNAGPGYPGPAFDILSRRMVDAWVAAGNPAEAPAGYTWPAGEPEMRIDFAWLSPGDWQAVAGSARALGGDAIVSDHRAVMVDVTAAAGR